MNGGREAAHTLVNTLIALSVTRVGARRLVVELAERGGVEVRNDAEHPGGGDGVERLEPVRASSRTTRGHGS